MMVMLCLGDEARGVSAYELRRKAMKSLVVKKGDSGEVIIQKKKRWAEFVVVVVVVNLTFCITANRLLRWFSVRNA